MKGSREWFEPSELTRMFPVLVINNVKAPQTALAPVPMPDTAGVVYVYSIEGVPGRVKIGFTLQADWRSRIAEQRHAGTPGALHTHSPSWHGCFLCWSTTT